MTTQPDDTPLPIAVSMGEPAGIGGELVLKAWMKREEENLKPFVVIDDPERLAALAKHLGHSVPIQSVSSGHETLNVFGDHLPVAPLDDGLAPAAVPGHPNPDHGEAVIGAIEVATQWVFEKQASAIVTNPIQKQSLYEAGFRYPGHTEYLAALTGSEGAPVMMLVSPQLRVVPVTIHVPISDVPNSLTTEAVIHAGRLTSRALRQDFGIVSPRISVAALNPHAGEGGTIGDEEARLIVPAIEVLRTEGIRVSGPHPADTLFHTRAREEADAVLCMYHDQALIPLKTLDFDRGVNMTLGLPIVRCSPDHGTALDIAGTGQADPSSFIEALRLAHQCTLARNLATT